MTLCLSFLVGLSSHFKACIFKDYVHGYIIWLYTFLIFKLTLDRCIAEIETVNEMSACNVQQAKRSGRSAGLKSWS